MVPKNPQITNSARCTAVSMSKRHFMFIFYQFTNLIIGSNKIKGIKIKSNFCFIPYLVLVLCESAKQSQFSSS